jgi:hypothetical protein
MISCKVRSDELQSNLESLRAVYEEMESVRPNGLRYVTFQLEDKVTFVAFAWMKDGPEVLQHLEAFQRYRAALDERCDEPPTVTVLHEVGSYGFQ